MTVLSFCESYRQHFEVVPAVDEALRRQNYRLRHEVYCRDLGYEPVRADGIESDDFDRHSLHCLIRTISSSSYVGCARLVLTDPEDRQRPLPFESTCADSLDRRIVDPRALDRTKIAEISRLAVLGRYRRRKGEGSQPFAMDSEETEGRRLRLPYLPVALYLALLAIARHQGIETLFVLTEPRLAGNINRLGVEITRIGDPIEHRGLRIPSMINVTDTIAGLNVYVRPFFELIAEEVAAGIAAPASVPMPGYGVRESLLRA